MPGQGTCFEDAALEAKKKDSVYHQVKEFLDKGETVAVATIVSSKGSTPREVGAKMVVTAWGEILGTIGGGCGEADVKREAIEVIRTRKPRMVRVDLLDDISSDSPAVCGGIMNIFVDPWWEERDAEPGSQKMSALSEELVRISEQGLSAVLATIVEAEGSQRVQPGAKCLVVDGKAETETIGDSRALEQIVRESEAVLSAEKSKLIALEIPDGGRLQVFFEVMLAPPKLIVVGAGHIAVPLVQIAKILDFHVTVIDDRLLYANRERFPAADEVLVGDMAQMLKEMTITPSCYIVLITRGHKYDEPCLRQILHSKAKYIGMIGSRRRIKACFQRFRDEEKIAEEVIERVYAPIGLDIATETPPEIALSILAEVVKVRRGGKAASLSGH